MRVNTGGFGKVRALACLFMLLAGLPSAWAATTPTPPGTIIHMQSTLTWQAPAGTQAQVSTLNTTQDTPVTGARTPSSVAFLAYAPGAGTSSLAGPTQCEVPGLHPHALPMPVSAQGTRLDTNQPLPLGPADVYYPGDPVFVRITDPDQNLDPNKRETIQATVGVRGGTQQARVQLSETGPDTGVFTGYVLTTSHAGQAGACVLPIKSDQRLQLEYTDPADPSDHSQADALVSPYNIAFDASTGKSVNGARITLINAQTGQPAAVIGRDGVSRFPSSVVSGQDVHDSSGADYPAAAGAYLLPRVKPGSYRFKVQPPTGYRFASSVSQQQLQKLSGAPFTLGPASFGKTFTLSKAQPIGFDIPLDPVSTHLFVQKTASAAVASVGDMLQYTVTVENTDDQLAAADVHLQDTLPQGLRYVPHSARVIHAKTAGASDRTVIDPSVASDGRHMDFVLGGLTASGQVQITYVVRVSAATPAGTATNVAQGFAAGGGASNRASAQVQIRNQLMQDANTIIGRVVVGCDNDGRHAPKGMAGVRILMEDGSYAVTDAEGRYHFPDVTNGTHVVQLDNDSLPAGYAVQRCRKNTRFAGRAYSQFVEVHGGALWHADFHVRKLPRPSGAVTLRLNQQRVDTALDTTLDMAVDTVPVDGLSATVLLPAASHYVAGSARLNGQRISDPQVMGGALVFRLGKRGAGWRGALRFALRGSGKAETTTALLNFNTPAARGQHTPAAKLTLNSTQARSAVQRKATRGRSPAAAKTESAPTTHASQIKPEAKAAGHKPKGIQLDAKWFAAAGPEAEFVRPTADANPASPAIKVAVKHAPGQNVRLSVNGKPVDPRNMLGVKTNARKTAAVSAWLGVPVSEGDNQLVADIMHGHELVKRIRRSVHYSGNPVRAEIVASESSLVADGKHRPHLAIRLYDRWGYPVREGLTGHFTLSAPYQSWRSIQALQKDPLNVTADARRPTYTVGKNGIADVELAPTTASGQLTVSVPLANDTRQQLHAWMKPGKRDWILVGVASGTAAFNQIHGHMRTERDDAAGKNVFQNGRVAFYAKGTIKGKYLLTLAYDTAKKKGLDSSGLRTLGQSIDPNQYFTLYGDASNEGHDAQSNSKLYVKIERGQFNAMFGEFDTGLTVTELTRYDRRFNGLKSQYQGKHIGYTAFAARNAQSYAKDEIQGNGTSGLYRLSHKLILLDSERIERVTRDRFHPEQVVSRQPLTRFVDYSIDYTTGTIFFKQPVPSVDNQLNPVYIVASYEVTRPGNQSVTAGGRVSWRSSDNRVEVGTTAVNEGSPVGDNRLSGVDARVELGKATELKAELAHTRTGAAGTSSQLGGYNPYGSVASRNNNNTSGLAWRINLKHQGKRVQGQLYARQLDAGFGLGQQSFGETGMRKLGGQGSYLINKYWRLNGQAWSERSLQNGTSRNAAEATARWHKDNNSLTFGLRHVDDNYLQPANYGSSQAQGGNGTTPPGPVQTRSGSADQVQLGGSTSVLHDKLKLHAMTSRNIGSSSDAAWPSLTNLGADYAMSTSTSLFLNQQYASGNHVAASRMTQLGVRSTPWKQAQVTSGIGQQMTEYGPRLFATNGLTQGWNVNQHLSLNAGFNQSKTLGHARTPQGSGTGGIVSVDSGATQPVPGSINPAAPSVAGTSTEDFTSGFLGAGWNRNDWSATSRIEMLHSSSEQRLGLMGGAYHQLSQGNGLAASLQAFKSHFRQGGENSQVNLRLSFAHRPEAGRWSLLEQLDLTWGNQQGLSGSPFLAQGSTGIVASQSSQLTPGQLANAQQGSPSTWGINQHQRKAVNNLQANFRGKRSEWSIYLGLKYATYTFDVGRYNSFTSMISSEYRYDITPRWDIGLIGSRLTSWRSHVSKNRFGVELGHVLGKNMWISLGYNATGFTDRDFSAAHFASKGMFVRFRMKFDQDTVRHMLGGSTP